MSVLAATGSDQNQALIGSDSEFLAHGCATCDSPALTEISTENGFRGYRWRKGVLHARIEDFGNAEHEHFVVVRSDLLGIAMRIPDRNGVFRTVQDVAQHERDTRVRLHLEVLEGSGELVLHAARLFVDQHQVGPEVHGRRQDEIGPQAHGLLDAGAERLGGVDVQRRPGETRQFDVVEPFRQTKVVNHRRASDQQNRNVRVVSIKYSLSANILRMFPIPNVSCEYTNSFRIVVFRLTQLLEVHAPFHMVETQGTRRRNTQT